LGGSYYPLFDPPYRIDSYAFSSPFKIELKPGVESVYIGTIQYHHDEDNTLKKGDDPDDYQTAARS
jgi:hypothetical protein